MGCGNYEKTDHKRSERQKYLAHTSSRSPPDRAIPNAWGRLEPVGPHS
jgi:hypothetical protein